MYTIVETEIFRRDADAIWFEMERTAFCVWLAANPFAGDVIPGSGGCRKLRWHMRGIGKRGGLRIIYYTKMEQGEIWLLLMYSKSVSTHIPAHLLKQIRETINDSAK